MTNCARTGNGSGTFTLIVGVFPAASDCLNYGNKRSFVGNKSVSI